MTRAALRRALRVAAALAGCLVAATGPCQRAVAASVSPGQPVSDPRRIEPSYWRERLFFIPFQPDPQQFLAGTTREVRLLVSRDGVAWSRLQTARPEVRGFSYHAPGDGEYFFAVQVADSNGRVTPETVSEPQLRVVIDSTKPTIKLDAAPGAAGAATLRYEVRDYQLAADSVQIDVREGAGPWRSVQVGPPDVQRSDRVAGQVTWGSTAGAGQLEFRVRASDRAGNTATQTSTAASGDAGEPFVSPALQRPNLSSPQIPPVESEPLQPAADGPSLGPAAAAFPHSPIGTPALVPHREAAGGLASATRPQEWPASNRPNNNWAPRAEVRSPGASGNTRVSGANLADRPAPPMNNSYASHGARGGFPPAASSVANRADATGSVAGSAARPDRTVFGHDPFAPSDRTTVGEAASRPLTAPPLTGGQQNPFAFATSSAANSPGGEAAASSAPAANGLATNGWAGNGGGPGGELPAGAMLVNTRTFDVDYDVSTAGDWGVARVELWGTNDNGATWRNLAVDPDARSPVRVTTPGAGLYGMRIVVHGANAAALPPPAAGAAPEMYVYVDLYPPGVNLLGVERGAGAQADQLRIRWAASDSHLAQRPITILYSSYETGPWSTAAANLENTGEFHWRLQRHLPERLFLRIEATDQSGNVGFAESKQPVSIDAPQPVGRLRGVRPSPAASGTAISPFGG